MSHEQFITTTGAFVYIALVAITALKFPVEIGSWMIYVIWSWMLVIPIWMVIMLYICPRLPEEQAP